MDTTPQQKYLELKARFSVDQWERLPLELQLYGDSLDSILRYFVGKAKLPVLDTRIFSGLSKELQSAVETESKIASEIVSEPLTARGWRLSEVFSRPKRRRELQKKMELHAAAQARREAAFSAVIGEYAFLGNLKELTELIDRELMGFALTHEELFDGDRSERLRNIELRSISNLAGNRSMASGLFSVVQHLERAVGTVEMRSSLSDTHLSILQRWS